jgi:hypothetical protein
MGPGRAGASMSKLAVLDREIMGSKGAAERRFLIFQTSARDALTLARHFAEQSEDRTRGIYFKIDEFFRDVFQRILAGLVYSMI